MQVLVTVDLGFGDSGKGSIVDYLSREYGASAVVRYNGGCQAGHNVVTPDGKHHCFSQFGAGTLAGAETYLSEFMLVEPLAMMSEAEHLATSCGIPVHHAFDRVWIDERALVVTPYHRSMNRLREVFRGKNRHGSCGMGIGEAVADAETHGYVLRVADIKNKALCHNKLELIRNHQLQKLYGLQKGPVGVNEQAEIDIEILHNRRVSAECVDEYRKFIRMVHLDKQYDMLRSFMVEGTVIFEGAQGVLLDQSAGFFPHVTRSTTTTANANRILAQCECSKPKTTLGLLRAYATRHGAGPFPTEADLPLKDPHNQTNPWQQQFRVGWFDLVLARYAARVAGKLDCLAVSHLDQISELDELKVCNEYDYEGLLVRSLQPQSNLKLQEKLTQLVAACKPRLVPVARDHYLDYISGHLQLPIGVMSYGPTASDKRSVLPGVRSGNGPPVHQEGPVSGRSPEAVLGV